MLLVLLMAYGLFVAECRYHQREDATTMTTEVKHRHRHRHEPSNRRTHHDLGAKSWQEVDYEYDGDSEEPIDEDDYILKTQSYYDHPRSHQRAAHRSYHGRMFEPRYPARHHGGGYHGNGWYDKDNDRRRTLSRYNTRNHRYRPGRTYHRPTYPRSRDFDDDDDNDTEEDYDYERPYRYVKNDGVDKRHEWWRNSRRHASYRKDWRSKVYDYPRDTRRHRLEDREGIIDRDDVSGWTDNWRRRSNSSESKYHLSKDDGKTEEDEDYEDHGGLEEGDKDEDEDDVWKDIDDEDEDEEEEEEELDNDFYKSGTKPLLRTYDDIIRRLTSDEPTTQRATVKRDYRNIEMDKHAKREGYHRDFKYEPRNVSRPTDLFKYASTRHAAITASNYFLNKRIAESSSVKSAAGSGGRKPPRNAIGVTVKGNDRQQRKTAAKTDDTQAKTKSLEQDYDEYPNGPDNEKEDDLVKAGVEEDSDMQADVTNAVSRTICPCKIRVMHRYRIAFFKSLSLVRQSRHMYIHKRDAYAYIYKTTEFSEALIFSLLHEPYIT